MSCGGGDSQIGEKRLKTLVVRNSGDIEDCSTLGTPPEIRFPVPMVIDLMDGAPLLSSSIKFTVAKPFTYERDIVVVYIEE